MKAWTKFSHIVILCSCACMLKEYDCIKISNTSSIHKDINTFNMFLVDRLHYEMQRLILAMFKTEYVFVVCEKVTLKPACSTEATRQAFFE